MKSNLIFCFACLFSFSFACEELMAQSSSYKLPPQAVVDIIDTPSAPGVSFSPNREWMLLVDRDAMPDIEDVSRRMLALAGMRIDPTSNGPFQTSFNRGITLVKRDNLVKTTFIYQNRTFG